MAIDNDNPTFAYFGKQGSTGVKFDPNNFRIETGVTPVNGQPNTYLYRHQSHEYPGGILIIFTASQQPILGDQVVNNVLVPRPLVPNPSRDVFQEEWPQPIINNDPGTQLKRINRRKVQSWPEDKAWID